MQLIYSEVSEYTVFLSSGDDALHLRDFVDDLVRNAVNSELDGAGLPIRLLVRRWERTAPGRADGESVNARFVRMATSSSITVCLLLARLGDGTREEIEAVLQSDDVELAIVWFVERTAWPDTEVGTFLSALRDRVQIDRAGVPDSPSAAVSLVRLLLHIVLQRLSQPEEAFRERRP